jgi:hypothetical protein
MFDVGEKCDLEKRCFSRGFSSFCKDIFIAEHARLLRRQSVCANCSGKRGFLVKSFDTIWTRAQLRIGACAGDGPKKGE